MLLASEPKRTAWILAVVAKQERIRISERTRAGLDRTPYSSSVSPPCTRRAETKFQWMKLR
jgi:hypothetical protein